MLRVDRIDLKWYYSNIIIIKKLYINDDNT